MLDMLTLTALTMKRDFRAAYKQILRHLAVASPRSFPEFVAQTRGGSGHGACWFERYRLWAQVSVESSHTRYWCAYGILSPAEHAKQVPICEINPPRLETPTQWRVSGAFATDAEGYCYYLHSGKFGGKFADVPADAFLAAYAGKQAVVSWPATVWDGKRQMCVVGRLGDEHFVGDIATFVHAVARFKNGQLTDRLPPPVDVGIPIGRTYVSPKEPTQSLQGRENPPIDPDTIDRGRHAHWLTELALVSYLRSHLGLTNGDDILTWAGPRPFYDVVWQYPRGHYWVAEVKSLTNENEDHQLRLGLGQVSQYRHWIAASLGAPLTQIQAVLMVETKPTHAPEWKAICAGAGVILGWPGSLDDLANRAQWSS